MKLKFLAVIALAAAAVTGCVSTVNDSHSFATTWSQDTITARYNRSPDQVYGASLAVIQNNGVLTREFITPTTNNIVIRSLTAKVNQQNVWIRVTPVDGRTTQVEVQARSSWGVSDVALSSELDKEIALQLSR
jgi:hypothetical protein